MKRLFVTYKSLTLSLLFIFLFSVTVSFASPLYNSSNTTLDPQCAPSNTNCRVATDSVSNPFTINGSGDSNSNPYNPKLSITGDGTKYATAELSAISSTQDDAHSYLFIGTKNLASSPGFGMGGNITLNNYRWDGISNVANNAGDILGEIAFRGSIVGGYQNTASINVITTTGTDARMQFIVNPNGGSTVGGQDPKMVILDSGYVGIGKNIPTTNLDVVGNAAISGSLTLGAPLAVEQGGTGGNSIESAYTSLGLPSPAYQLRQTWNKLTAIHNGDNAQLRVLVFGDSVAYKKPTYIIPLLQDAYGHLSGEANTQNGTSGDVTVPDATGNEGLTYWPVSNFQLGPGGSQTFGCGGSYCKADILKIYYIKHSGSGTFKVQVDAGSGFVDESGYTNVDASNSSAQLGIITIPKAYQGYQIRLVGVTGRVDIITPYFKTISKPGVELFRMDRGGLALGAANGSSAAILTAWLADVAPDLGFFEMKEGPDFATDLENHQARFDAGAPQMDWIYMGSTPQATLNDSLLQQNAVLRTFAKNHDKFYFDGYTPVKSYANLVALNTPNTTDWSGDGLHVGIKTDSYLASILVQQARFFDNSFATSPYSSVGGKIGSFTNSISLQGPGHDIDNPTLSITTDNTFGTDTLIKSRVINLAGTDGTINWSFGSAQYVSHTPDYFRIGAADPGPYIQKFNSQMIGFVSSPYQGTIDLAARSYISDIVNGGFYGSKFVSLDAGGGYAPLTLAGSSFIFSNHLGAGTAYGIFNATGLGVGNTSPSYLLHVGSNAITTGTTVARFQNGGGTCDVIPSTSGGITCSSDYNLKKNITTLSTNTPWVYQTGTTQQSDTILNKVLALQPVQYNWNTEQDTDTKHAGFIAQDVQQLFPDLVTTDPTTHLLSLNYTGLLPYTVQALQDINITVTSLADTTKPNSLRDSLVAWLSNSTNGITRIFTGEVCLSESGQETECINRAELKSLKALLQQQSSGGGGSTTSSVTPAETAEAPQTTEVVPVQNEVQNTESVTENTLTEPVSEAQP